MPRRERASARSIRRGLCALAHALIDAAPRAMMRVDVALALMLRRAVVMLLLPLMPLMLR